MSNHKFAERDKAKREEESQSLTDEIRTTMQKIKKCVVKGDRLERNGTSNEIKMTHDGDYVRSDEYIATCQEVFEHRSRLLLELKKPLDPETRERMHHLIHHPIVVAMTNEAAVITDEFGGND